MKVAQILMIALVVGISGCGSGTSTSGKKPYTNTDGYPLDTCVVSGEKLGTMGDPFIIKYQQKTVKFCCGSCLKEFNKEPAKYMSILEEAEKKNKEAEAKSMPVK